MLGDDPAELMLAVLRDGDRPLTLADPATITWPLESDTFEFEVVVDAGDANVLLTGAVASRQISSPASGVWVEVRYKNRALVRSATPTDHKGRFAITLDRRALADGLGHAGAELAIVIVDTDG